MSTVYQEDYAYPVEEDKYRLVVAHVCPFAHRASIARELLGLDKVISLAVTHPVKTERIWSFADQKDGQDPVLEVEYLQELYHNTNADYEGPYSVPALVDIETKTVVNQESLDLVYDFAHRWTDFHSADAPELFLVDLEDEIRQAIDWLGEHILMRSAQAGMAKDQEEYEKYHDQFFEAMDELDQALKGKNYLIGDQLTAADIVAYTPLVRFDSTTAISSQLFDRALTDYDHLWPYMHKLYQIPAFKNTTHFDHILKGSYLGKTGRLYFQREIIPAGLDFSHWD